MLRLMFVCCHPSLTTDAQTTLTLKLVGGLTTREIARSFLTTEATVAQRVVRAKRTLADAGAALEEPDAAERRQRLAAVLCVVYLLFNEGYSATAGDDWMRPALCDEAMRLGRILGALVPTRTPRCMDLSALMELQSSRLRARTGPDGEPVLLLDQDRTPVGSERICGAGWMRSTAPKPLPQGRQSGVGSYTLQAAIAACHARARTAEETDWVRIAALYEQLARISGSPVVEVNRAVALGDGLRPGRRTDPGRPARRPAGAARLPPAAQRAGRSAGQARPARGGAGGVRAGRGDDEERPGARAVARPGQPARRGEPRPRGRARAVSGSGTAAVPDRPARTAPWPLPRATTARSRRRPPVRRPPTDRSTGGRPGTPPLQRPR